MEELNVNLHWIGEDLLISVEGGEKPHIGCTVLAVPRPSLRGDGTLSCTSSVINVTGHKDEMICRKIAEKAVRKYGCTVVCAGGFHKDRISEEEIDSLMEKVDQLEL